MKRKSGWVFWVVLIMVWASAGASEEPRPERVLVSPMEFKQDDLTGQVVLIDFWASWCQPCKKSLPWLNRMQAQYGPQGFQVVTVNLDRNWNQAAPMARIWYTLLRSSLIPSEVWLHLSSSLMRVRLAEAVF